MIDFRVGLQLTVRLLPDETGGQNRDRKIESIVCDYTMLQ